MHITVEMTEQDHFLATTFIREATPTFLDPKALAVLASAMPTGKDRTYRIEADLDDVQNLAWAMDRCVELIELDCSRSMTQCCDAFDHDSNLRLDAATKRLEAEIEGYLSNIDHDGDEASDEDLVECGPEYPRNDAGEWVGRM